ncbi:hypothetical protein SLE2022_315680 [Rubroshorea leprosula]
MWFVDGTLRQREYICSKQGFHRDGDSCNVKKINHLETRMGCKARIRFTVSNGIWEVTHFNDEHNHELANQEERRNLRSGRKILEVQGGVISSMVNVGIKPTNHTHSWPRNWVE